MKIRNGFVSNSSSSSFIIRVPESEVPFNEIADTYGINKDIPDIDRYYISSMVGLAARYGKDMDADSKEGLLDYYNYRINVGDEKDKAKFSGYKANLAEGIKHVHIEEDEWKLMRIPLESEIPDDEYCGEYWWPSYSFDLNKINCELEDIFTNPEMVIYSKD